MTKFEIFMTNNLRDKKRFAKGEGKTIIVGYNIGEDFCKIESFDCQSVEQAEKLTSLFNDLRFVLKREKSNFLNSLVDLDISKEFMVKVIGLYDYKHKGNAEVAYAALHNFMNILGNIQQVEEFVKEYGKDHPTIQQGVVGLCFKIISTTANFNPDLRTEFVVERCKFLVDAYNAQFGYQLDLDVPCI